MIPKKPNVLYKQVAEDLNIAENLVDAFMTFYYKTVRKNLSEINYTKINLDGLGVMAVKPRTVDGLINKYSNRVDKLNTDTMTNYHYKKRVEDKIELLLKVKKMLDNDVALKQEFLKNKRDEQAGKNMEE
jgi:hypothetical protein